MKKTTKVIISLFFTIIASVKTWLSFETGRTMCYYAGDNYIEFQELRDLCYANYPVYKLQLKMFFVIITVFSVIYFGLAKLDNYIKFKNNDK